MKFFVAVLGLLSMSVSTDAGASMHNPFYCYTTDPIKPMSSMLATITSYEATRRFNFTTVNPYVSSTVHLHLRLCNVQSIQYNIF